MSKRRNTVGAGHVPAPRGDVDKATAVLDELRAELREARGALGDLLRERKAVEQLARDRAEKAIETHVNACIQQLTDHVNVQIREYGEGILTYFQSLLNNFCDPSKHGMPDRPTVPEVLSALEIIKRAQRRMEEDQEAPDAAG